jgi:hypothetical protein
MSLFGPTFGRDILEDRFDQRPSGFATAGHDARTKTRALFATGNAGADVKQALRLDVLGATFGIAEVRVAAVDDHVAFFQQRNQLLDESVNRRKLRIEVVLGGRHGVARLDHQHHLAGRRQIRHEVFERLTTDERLALRLGFLGVDEVAHLAGGAIEHGNFVAVVDHVEHQVLPHHCQADQAKIIFFRHFQFLSWVVVGGTRSEGRGTRERLKCDSSQNMVSTQAMTPPLATRPFVSILVFQSSSQ